MFFSIKDLLKQGSKVYKNVETNEEYRGLYMWKSIFGAPIEYTGDDHEAAFMNEHPEAATFFRGSLLMHIEAEEQEKPVRAV
jgi:hypothetical protein